MRANRGCGYCRSVLAVRLLGPLEIEVDNELVRVTAPMQRALLISLALAPGHTLSRDQLVDALWEVEPPARAGNVVQQYVSALRTILGRDHIITLSGGYRLEMAGGSVDVTEFHSLVRHASHQRRAGNSAAGARTLGEALSMCRGEPLSGVPDIASLVVVRESAKRAVLEARTIRASLENDLGRADSALAEVAAVASAEPLDEAVAVEWMRALAATGRQADALAVYGRIRARLAEELGVEPTAQLRAAHLAVLRQDPRFAHEPVQTDLTRLPWPVSALLARDDDVAAVERLMADPRVKIVCVTGPGGVGKTRLVLELAGRAAEAREVVYVPLDSIKSANLVIPSIAGALQVKQQSDTDLVSRTAIALRGRDLLLVLDNLEQVLDAATEVARLIELAHGVQLLVTSREAMRIHGEHVHPLGPLRTADEGHVPPAVQLFELRALETDRGYRIEQNRETVRQICIQLDGLPLAIELAAARTALLSPAQIAARLSRRLGLLTTGTRDAPTRHGSLRACLAWSVDLLDQNERLVFATAAVFEGGADVDALELVCQQALPGVDPLDTIQSLVSKSLIRHVQGQAGPRLAMLETVREFAQELLVESGLAEVAERAHAHYFHTRFAASPDVVPWPPCTVFEIHAWLADLPNARIALATLTDMGDIQRYADLVVNLSPLWQLLGHQGEREQHLKRLGERINEISPGRRVDVLLLCIDVALTQARVDIAEQHYADAAALLADHPDPTQEVQLHVLTAYLEDLRGKPRSRPDSLDTAMRITREALAPEMAAVVDLMSLPLRTADLDRHVADARRSLHLIEESGNQMAERMALLNLSECVLASSDPDLVARGVDWGRRGHEPRWRWAIRSTPRLVWLTQQRRQSSSGPTSSRPPSTSEAASGWPDSLTTTYCNWKSC